MTTILLLALPLIAQAKDVEAQKTFDEANQRFEKGELDDAFTRYTTLAARGFGGVPLYYNLGNAHYRRGERGKALLWYERAARLAPRDSDVRFNLALARSHIKLENEGVLSRAVTYFDQNELAVSTAAFSAIFFLLVGLLTLGKIRAESWSGLAIIVAGVLFAGSGGWLGLRGYLDRRPQAVVVAPPGEVRNGPGSDYAVGFTVPEGSKVLILNSRPDWIQVGVPEQGLKGWMPADEVEAITSKGLL